MTALTHIQAVADTHDVDVLAEVEVLVAALDDFLRDPIGYGDYDFTDPISLKEFLSHRHMRGPFISALG
jgi:hypothetical protein